MNYNISEFKKLNIKMYGGEEMRIDRYKLINELMRQEMTQKRLAELAGISRASVNYIKSGKSCSDEVGHKIADALNVPLETLLEN